MTRIGFVALCALIGCQKRVPAPAANTVELAGLKAPWRDYAAAKVDVCELAEPKMFASDVEAMNALLTKFVDQTSGGMEGVWSEEQAKLLEDGAAQLKPALDAHEAALRASNRCKFDAALDFDRTRRKSEELSKLARKRIEDPALLEYAKKSAALLAWKDRQPEEHRGAREQWCPPKAKRGSPDIYYVFTDENGQTEYLFCDGSKVVAAEGKKPEYVSPDAKRVPIRPYLDAAASYPAEEIIEAPRLPAPKAATEDEES